MDKITRDRHKEMLAKIARQPDVKAAVTILMAYSVDECMELLEMLKYSDSNTCFSKTYPEHSKALKEYCNNKIAEIKLKTRRFDYLPLSEQLDIVLELFINPNVNDEYLSSNEVIGELVLNRPFIADESHCITIINQLCDDSYLTRDVNVIKNSETYKKIRLTQYTPLR